MTSDGHTIAARNMDGETDPQYLTVNDVLVQAVAGEGERRFVSVMWPGWTSACPPALSLYLSLFYPPLLYSLLFYAPLLYQGISAASRL